MRILHLFANWKWTGPAEPALNQAWYQSREHAVLFISGQAPQGQSSRIVPQAQARGVEVRGGLQLGKHARLRRNRQDAATLARLLAEFRPDIVHTHLDNDHRIASVAVARTGIGRLVRTAYDPDGLPHTLRMRLVARRALHGLIVTTRSGLAQTLEHYGGALGAPPGGSPDGAPRAVLVDGRLRPLALIEGGVDLARFDPARCDRAAARARLGLAPEHVAIGIVARVQAHRRFEVLLDAHERVHRRHPQLRLVVIGRGTQIRSLLLEPIEARGLSGSIITTGYLDGEQYPAALAALDASLFLVPGSDGTCRALREQQAMGLPAIVTPRVPLPEIIEDGRTGLVAQESVDGLAGALERLVTDAALRERLRAGALSEGRRRFDLAAQGAAVLGFYEQVLAAGE